MIDLNLKKNFPFKYFKKEITNSTNSRDSKFIETELPKFIETKLSNLT